jgi:hypothetical protein
MGRLRIVVLACFLATPLGALAGTPGTMTLVSDDRFVNAFGDPWIGGEECGPSESVSETPSPDFAFFDATVSAGAGGGATQTSSAETGQLSGSGSASGYSDICYGYGRSNYDVTFTLTGPTLLDLTGTIDSLDLAFGYGETTARLTRGAEVIYEEVTDPFIGMLPLAFSETVEPGTYRLLLIADGEIWISSSWSFTLDADPVAAPSPVPALGGAGLAALTAGLAVSGAVAARRYRKAR